MAAYATRYPDLEGKAVFVSGGATGIGAAIVEAFCWQGAHTYFVDIDVESAEALTASVAEKTGTSPFFHRCDVTDTQALRDAIERASEVTGALYALVNNAARDLRVPADEVTEDVWDDLVAINLKHQFFAAQTAYRLMAPSGCGSIINFGSIAPGQGVKNLSVYSSCKSAAFGLTRSLARDFGTAGVRVNSIIPGAILTPRQLRDWIDPDTKREIIERQCLKRAMQEDDVAEMVLFLASNASRGCTAQEFTVDGGNI
ncbi:SDR family oxidoreductase [Nisaea acidiphila]|uniref:SDR family oxidoreductase n=1 Tax=Nisaea acidiphila TaxID=1862145 RepID=A0A9J7AWW6_9PROT|nr:SDR family oxidoreductase [Nisaea acidiphila]UUX49941.1 SDR family oxidoreductase [Nisaea acidiphila]